MKQSLQLRLGQQLTMTPQLQQAIRLLQLSSLELQTEIQQALESNPMLEETPEEELAEEGPSAEAAGEDQGEAAAERAEASEVDVDIEKAELPDDLPLDNQWDDFYDSPTAHGVNPDATGREYENRADGGESLHDQLTWQLDLTPFSEQDHAIAVAIVDAIGEDGYLSQTLEEIQQAVAGDELVELDEVEAVLHRVQNFDPPGVGARDLRECLLLQMRALPEDTPWLAEARLLVTEHLDLLGKRDFNQVMRKTKLSQDQLRDALALIQRLDPRPGYQVSDAETQYVVPDVFVYKRKGQWHVDLNPEASPRLRVNPTYAALVRRADNSPDNTYLRSNLQEARWFLKSLQSRNETLLRVATAIVERQQGFLEKGDEAMQALVLHDIAETLGMHESTISRVTSHKYMHTPRGIYELKYFFSSHVSTADGGECSSTAIRAHIKRLVGEERPDKPLSDNKIAQLLADMGIQVARRTVAKYREAMAIPPSNERKRLA
jgi:RNA polymerase sigma-54 factor